MLKIERITLRMIEQQSDIIIKIIKQIIPHNNSVFSYMIYVPSFFSSNDNKPVVKLQSQCEISEKMNWYENQRADTT